MSSFSNCRTFAAIEAFASAEDLRRRAVVHGEVEPPRVRVALLELEDVREVRAAERVDALRVVADDAEVPVLARDEVDDVALQPVRVLVLVDEHVPEARRRAARGRLAARRAGSSS